MTKLNNSDFKDIKKYKNLGLSIRKTAAITNVPYRDVSAVWNFTHDQFEAFLRSENEKVEFYREFILDMIETTPTITSINIYYKLKEQYPEFKGSESNFKKYVKKLRTETGYDRFTKFQTTIRENSEPGEEMQVDFGEYNIKDIYGKFHHIYFYVMVLRYSQLKYVEFRSEKFNTENSITAHIDGFRFFGGVPRVLVYDQDSVFLKHENFGNLILAKDFEKFVKDNMLSVIMCGPSHPQSKGTVENYVRIVKESFLEGRVYTGIDSLNSACLEWLDNSENNHILVYKKTTPHELFKEERKHLRKMNIIRGQPRQVFYKVNNNSVRYHYSLYEVPIGYNGLEVKVEGDGDVVIIKDPKTEEIIANHKYANSRDSRVRLTLTEREKRKSNNEFIVENYYKNNETALEFLKILKESNWRYYPKMCYRLRIFLKIYKEDELNDAFKHFIESGWTEFSKFLSYLVTTYGDEKGKLALGRSLFYYYKKIDVDELVKGAEIKK